MKQSFMIINKKTTFAFQTPLQSYSFKEKTVSRTVVLSNLTTPVGGNKWLIESLSSTDSSKDIDSLRNETSN